MGLTNGQIDPTHSVLEMDLIRRSAKILTSRSHIEFVANQIRYQRRMLEILKPFTSVDGENFSSTQKDVMMDGENSSVGASRHFASQECVGYRPTLGDAAGNNLP